jgi:antitoxin YefM
MFAVYRTSVDELDQQFLDGLKKAFAHKEIEITVSDADETDYLLRSPSNREQLLRAVADIERNRNIVVPEQQAFQ